MPPTGSRGIPPNQGRPSTASHPSKPVLPQPMASLLPFLLRQPRPVGAPQWSVHDQFYTEVVSRFTQYHGTCRGHPSAMLI
jgi:hypothetical protein